MKGAGNIKDIMKQAQQMQKKLQSVQESADQIKGSSSTGGGMVKVLANGRNLVESITIHKDAVDPGEVDLLQDMLLAAVNEALKDAQAKLQEEIQKATGGMVPPGLM